MIELSHGPPKDFVSDCRAYAADQTSFLPHLTYDACERACYLMIEGQNLLVDREGEPLVLPVMHLARESLRALRECATSGNAAFDLAKWWDGPDLHLGLHGERVMFGRADLNLFRSANLADAIATAEKFLDEIVVQLLHDCPLQAADKRWAPFLNARAEDSG